MKIEKLINNIKKFKDTLKIKEKRLDLQEKYLVKLTGKEKKEEEIKKDFYVIFDFFGSYFLLPSLIFWLIKGDFSGFSYLFMFLIILSPVGMMSGLLEPF